MLRVQGILFLVLMLHPSHGETRNRVLAKEGVFGLFAAFFLFSSIFSTVSSYFKAQQEWGGELMT